MISFCKIVALLEMCAGITKNLIAVAAIYTDGLMAVFPFPYMPGTLVFLLFGQSGVNEAL